MTEYKKAATCMFFSVSPYLYTKFYTYGISEITICMVTAILIIANYFHWGYDVREHKWYTRACYATIVFGFILNIHSMVEILMYFFKDQNNLVNLASVLYECCYLSIYTVIPCVLVVILIFFLKHDIYINRNHYTFISTLFVFLLAHVYVYSYVTYSFLQALILTLLFYAFLLTVLIIFIDKRFNKRYFYLKIIACVFDLINFAYWMSLIKNQSLIST